MAFKRRYNPGCECCYVAVGSDFYDYTNTFNDCFLEGTDGPRGDVRSALAGYPASELLVELQQCDLLICGLAGEYGRPMVWWTTDQWPVLNEWIESGGRMIYSGAADWEMPQYETDSANAFLAGIGSSMSFNRTLEDGSCQVTLNIPDVPIVHNLQYVHGPTSTINPGSSTVIGYTTDSNTPFVCVEQLGYGYIMLCGTYYVPLGCGAQMNCGLIKNFVKMGTLI